VGGRKGGPFLRVQTKKGANQPGGAGRGGGGPPPGDLVLRGGGKNVPKKKGGRFPEQATPFALFGACFVGVFCFRGEVYLEKGWGGGGGGMGPVRHGLPPRGDDGCLGRGGILILPPFGGGGPPWAAPNTPFISARDHGGRNS